MWGGDGTVLFRGKRHSRQSGLTSGAKSRRAIMCLTAPLVNSTGLKLMFICQMPSSSVLFELQERPEMTCFIALIINLSVYPVLEFVAA